MITLIVEDYCQSCGHFKPECITSENSSFDEPLTHDTNIFCKRRFDCDRIYAHLKKGGEENMNKDCFSCKHKHIFLTNEPCKSCKTTESIINHRNWVSDKGEDNMNDKATAVTCGDITEQIKDVGETIADLIEAMSDLRKRAECEKTAKELKLIYDSLINAGFNEQQAWKLFMTMVAKEDF